MFARSPFRDGVRLAYKVLMGWVMIKLLRPTLIRGFWCFFMKGLSFKALLRHDSPSVDELPYPVLVQVDGCKPQPWGFRVLSSHLQYFFGGAMVNALLFLFAHGLSKAYNFSLVTPSLNRSRPHTPNPGQVTLGPPKLAISIQRMNENDRKWLGFLLHSLSRLIQAPHSHPYPSLSDSPKATVQNNRHERPLAEHDPSGFQGCQPSRRSLGLIARLAMVNSRVTQDYTTATYVTIWLLYYVVFTRVNQDFQL